jgi:hypothetical protein
MGAPSAPGTRSESPRTRIEGVEEPLPPGEHLLWQGRPDLRTLTLRALHLRAVLFYWAVVAAGFVLAGSFMDRGPGDLAADLVWLFVVGLLGAGVLFGLAAAVRGSTTYALTDRRILIRLGVALPATFNLPLHQVDAVDLRDLGGGKGDLVFTPSGADRVGWLLLWPHAKPWAFRNPLPAFRAVPDAASVGRQIAAAVAAARKEASE